jgi:TrmH family RNA methyltransferase
MARCSLPDGRCGRLGKPCASGRCVARRVHRLQDRRWREKLGLFAAEGEDLVDAGLEAGLEPADLLAAGENVTAELLAAVSTLPHSARKIAVFRRGDLPAGKRPVGVALWRVADPGNVGAILRSADALGPAFVALSAGCADPTGPKAVRGSMGALFRVPVVPFDDISGRRVALVAHGGEPLDEVDLGGDVTLVLGSEREGLPAEVTAACDAQATIPVEPGAESLNVAAAAALALYERRRRG